MDIDVPYMPSIKNLVSILDKIQHAAVPEAFTHDFLKDLGFTSSNDRSITKMFKYLGFLDASSRPQSPYREFVDHNKTKSVLANRIKAAFDDLYAVNKKAHEMTVDALKGWFKSKTGKGDAVALKMASTFKALASYADFSKVVEAPPVESSQEEPKIGNGKKEVEANQNGSFNLGQMGLVYRFEIHLPDTQNVDTFRAIFKAMREELMG
jgi:hypothetical protein